MFRKFIPPVLTSHRSLLTRALGNLQEDTYRRIREMGFHPNTVVDVGAWHGHWSETTAKIFPDANFFMFDALEESRPYLERFEREQFNYQICVLAAESGVEREFSVNATGSSLFPERSNAPRSIKRVRTTTLDEALDGKRLAAPIFLKLDVQGAELDVLRGGSRTLRQCELVQMEVALLNYNEGAPEFADVVSFMNERGFKLFEIAGFVRPTGAHLVQIDAVFASENSPLRPSFFQFK